MLGITGPVAVYNSLKHKFDEFKPNRGVVNVDDFPDRDLFTGRMYNYTILNEETRIPVAFADAERRNKNRNISNYVQMYREHQEYCDSPGAMIRCNVTCA